MVDYSPGDMDAIFKRVSAMSAEDLSALLVHLGNVEHAAAVEMKSESTLTIGGVVDRIGITDEVSVTVTAPSVATGTGFGRVTVTGTGVGYAPPVPPSEAVASLWDAIKPKSTEDALAISRELRRWVLILLLIVGAGASTPGLLAALEDAFRSSVDSMTKDAATDADPAAE